MTAFAEMNDGLVEAARRRQGSILNGKWRLDGLLGVGGMAAVYAATHRNGHRVAIKVLHTHFSLDEGFCPKLQQEGYVANLIDHPGALRILDDDRTEDGAVFLVMELLEGEALDARLKRKGWRLPAAEALGIGYSRAGRAGGGARQGDRPPRHQARQRLRHPIGGDQGAGLRHRPHAGHAARA